MDQDERVHTAYEEIYKEKRWVTIEFIKQFIKDWESVTGKLRRKG